MADNPFAYPPQQDASGMPGNPFDATGEAPPPQQQQQQTMGSASFEGSQANVGYTNGDSANPFLSHAAPEYGHASATYGMPYQNGGNHMAYQQPPAPSFSTSSVSLQQQPLNLYSGGTVTTDYSQQALVPVSQQANPWAISSVATPLAGGGPAGFDPFAPPPPPPPEPVLALVPAAPRHMEPYSNYQQDDNPFGPLAPDEPSSPVPDPETLKPAAQLRPTRRYSEEHQPTGEAYNRHPASSYDRDGRNHHHHHHHDENRMVVHEPPENRMVISASAKFRDELSRQAPPGSSPLPKTDLVRKRGFVLSRISFRTIVMKKWKQAYWVQYGPHTMLWFRSQSDFEDWLNNPYHNQTQRNFLIKLAVNFVHDLYKPNVRGYQVTQCRTKAYGRKMVRQFKLERWMDYGPTIAAAFGSYNPKEVDDLREALVECMRNTPLNGGIRATGAVRQSNDDEYVDDDRRGDDGDEDGPRRNYANSIDEPPQGEPGHPSGSPDPESVAEEADLLDVDNWDDIPLNEHQQPQSSASYGHQDQASAAYSQYSQPDHQSVASAPPTTNYQFGTPTNSANGGNPFGQSPVQGQPPYQQSPPAASPNPFQTYPGAPPVPQMVAPPIVPQQHMPPSHPQYSVPSPSGQGQQQPMTIQPMPMPLYQQDSQYSMPPQPVQQQQFQDPWATEPPPSAQPQPPFNFSQQQQQQQRFY